MNKKIIITGASGFIGTNLLQFYIDKGYEVINIDFTPPRNNAHKKYWRNIDITNFNLLSTEISKIDPNYVIHLAAKTDLDGKTLTDYNANTEGIINIINSLKKCKNLKRVIFASSQLVCSGRMPVNDDDYNVINLYGESKKQGELIVKNDYEIHFEWAIIRPTSIWGPWFREPYRKFFDMVISKTYFHIGKNSCIKTYGFIENLIYQVDSILNAPTGKIQGNIFYLGDYEPININIWANEIASEIGNNINTIPYPLIKLAAICGDVLKLFKINFPMTSFRLKNMTTNNIVELSKTKEIAPNLPITRIDGIKKTLHWIKNQE